MKKKLRIYHKVDEAFIHNMDDLESKYYDVLMVESIDEIIDMLDSGKLVSDNYDEIVLNDSVMEFLSFGENYEEEEKKIEELLKRINVTILLNGHSIVSTHKLLERYPILKKCRVMFNGNFYNGITYDEFKEIDEYTDKIAAFVNKFNLSPFEKTIFLADLIRELKYKERHEDDRFGGISRDLFDILHFDYIVCEGYANIFNAVLDKLGIGSSITTYYHSDDADVKEKTGHATCSVFIEDDKYNIHKPFEYDLTWGSNNNYGFLDNYKYIAMPSFLDKKLKYLLSGYSDSFGGIKSMRERVEWNINTAKELYKNSAPKQIVENSINRIVTMIDTIFKEDGKDGIEKIFKDLNINFEKLNIEKKLSFLEDLYECEIKDTYYAIPNDIFMRALYNVKRVEKSIDNVKYDFTIKDIYTIAYNRHSFFKSIERAEKKSDVRAIRLDSSVPISYYVKKIDDPDIIGVLLEHANAVSDLREDYEKMYDDEESSLEKDLEMMRLISALRKAGGEELKNPVIEGRKIK